MPVEKDLTGIWSHETDRHIKCRRLTGTVWAEQTDDFAALHVDIDTVNDATPTVDFNQSFGVQENIVVTRIHRYVAQCNRSKRGDKRACATKPKSLNTRSHGGLPHHWRSGVYRLKSCGTPCPA